MPTLNHPKTGDPHLIMVGGKVHDIIRRDEKPPPDPGAVWAAKRLAEMEKKR